MPIIRGPIAFAAIGYPETGWIVIYRGEAMSETPVTEDQNFTEKSADTLRRYAGTLVSLDKLHSGTRGQIGDILEMAWGIIANAYHGDWESAPDDWRQAAERWRDEMYHPWMRDTPAWCASDGADYPCDTARLLHPERYRDEDT